MKDRGRRAPRARQPGRSIRSALARGGRSALAALFVVAAAGLAAAQQPETMSMLEAPLYAPPLPADVRVRLEAELAAARGAYAKDRSNADAGLALFRAEMALGRIGDALEAMTHIVEAKPDDARLYLERARALIAYRKFDAAERDARKALETLPDATCTLGLALYLKAEFSRARDAYAKCPDAGIFSYLADRRAGGSAVPPPALAAEAEAAAPDARFPGSTLMAGHRRLPMTAAYLEAAQKIAIDKGSVARDAKGRRKPDPAEDALREIVEKDKDRWMEPVYIAAEADYARILKAEGKFKKPAAHKKKR